jgi:hypothetical protein
MSSYRLEVVARVPAASGPPSFDIVDHVKYNTVTYEETMNRHGSLQFSTRPETLTAPVKQRFRDLLKFPTEMWLYDGVDLVAAGICTSFTFQNGTLTFYCHSLSYYMDYMYVASDIDFNNTDQFTIAKWFVDQWQALSYGHFGIDTSTVGTSGVNRDRNNYYRRAENQQITYMLNNLSEVINGFDWTVLPNRKLHLGYPQMGIDNSEVIILDNRNITDDTTVGSVQEGDVASVALGTGTSTNAENEAVVITTTQVNNDVLQSFGRVAVAETWDGVSQQATLDGHASKLLQPRSKMMLKPSSKLIPVEGIRRSDFSLGDTITYSYDYGLGVYTEQHRVIARRISIDDANNETIDVELD